MRTIASLILLFALSLLPAPSPAAAGSGERAKRIKEREQQFLLRITEDLGKTEDYVRTALAGVEDRASAIDSLEPKARERDLAALRGWYRSYGDWLASILLDAEADLAQAYDTADQQPAVRRERLSALADGYSRLGSELSGQIAQLERLQVIAQQRIESLRAALDFLASAAFLEEQARERDHKPPTDRRKNELYERYREVSDSQIAQMQVELRTLGDLQRHYVVLLEQGRMELSWINRKVADAGALAGLAAVVGRDAPRSIEDAAQAVIRQYEADQTFFRRMAEDLGRERARIVPSGSLRDLDRAAELSDQYDRMKARCDRHIAWLGQQIGAYQADLVVLQKDK